MQQQAPQHPQRNSDVDSKQQTTNNTVIYWFRNDLRLSDNPALTSACRQAWQQKAALALVVFLPDAHQTAWGFTRVGQHRKRYFAETVRELAAACALLGNRLLVLAGDPRTELPKLILTLNAISLYCEDIAAPEEIAQITSLQQQINLMNGFHIHHTWQSSLLEPAMLPFAMAEIPTVFTSFRHLVEKKATKPQPPLAGMLQLPAMPPAIAQIPGIDLLALAGTAAADPRSAFAYQQPHAKAGEVSALQHLQRYFQSGQARRYKETRNGLIGFDYSTKFSPWLAIGALSARQIYQQLAVHEAEQGQNDSTYWIWFELLWRDYFRFLHLRFGRQMYLANGLKTTPQPQKPKHQPELFQRWCQGKTGQPLIDAGMRELAATGYLSNRMRQIVASFLVNDLQCDWRAGAAWFESQLIDFDVYSNQGNWLYLAGVGTDPRANRRFNLEKQVQSYDPDQAYLKLWLQS